MRECGKCGQWFEGDICDKCGAEAVTQMVARQPIDVLVSTSIVHFGRRNFPAEIEVCGIRFILWQSRPGQISYELHTDYINTKTLVADLENPPRNTRQPLKP